MAGSSEAGDHRENPPISGIVQHDSYIIDDRCAGRRAVCLYAVDHVSPRWLEKTCRASEPRTSCLLSNSLQDLKRHETSYPSRHASRYGIACRAILASAQAMARALVMIHNVSPLASHQGEPGSMPGRATGFSQVGIVPRTMPLFGGFSPGYPTEIASRQACSSAASARREDWLGKSGGSRGARRTSRGRANGRRRRAHVICKVGGALGAGPPRLIPHAKHSRRAELLMSGWDVVVRGGSLAGVEGRHGRVEGVRESDREREGKPARSYTHATARAKAAQEARDSQQHLTYGGAPECWEIPKKTGRPAASPLRNFHTRKSGGDPAGNRTRFLLGGGE
ncbi:hypothetical protein PR048_010590 [Dryococelus australis]|uniref:Uncharacterized protein n=1 Tax=Dryococelus australis TaxID=614101 RepID=A0ABQ9I3Z4_9NEOP|nr:hypothetical protein PR048_010590 [Dryococelus australis]